MDSPSDAQPLQAAAEAITRAEQTKDSYIFDYTPGMTIYDRFKDISAPGGIRMMNRVCDAWEVKGMQLGMTITGFAFLHFES